MINYYHIHTNISKNKMYYEYYMNRNLDDLYKKIFTNIVYMYLSKNINNII